MSASAGGPLNILCSCVGRRVELVQAFRAAARRLGVTLRIVATDSSPIAPALGCADLPILAPAISDSGYIAHLLDVVSRNRIRALIPTIDTDLTKIAAHRAQFEALGCTPMIGDERVVHISGDKIATFEFLTHCGIDTPATFTPDQIRALPARSYPYFLKPRFGSASKDARKIVDDEEFEFYVKRCENPIIQEFVDGVEYTLDVYVGMTGQPRCVVPRLRVAVRGGEVAQGIVVKDLEIMNAGKRLVDALGTSMRGLVTLQCMLTRDRRLRFIEINARFGGGAPLGIAAGADYPAWLIEELLGRTPVIAFDGFEHGLATSRYDWAAFLPLGADALPKLVQPKRPYPDFG